MALGFELKTFGTQVSSRNHKVDQGFRPPNLSLSLIEM